MADEPHYTVQWASKATAQLLRIDQRYALTIRRKASELKDFPNVHLDIKHLDGNQYRLRHGNYRIFFEVIDDIPKIIRIQQVKRRTGNTYKH